MHDGSFMEDKTLQIELSIKLKNKGFEDISNVKLQVIIDPNYISQLKSVHLSK